LDDYRDKLGVPVPDYDLILKMGICPISMIDDFSLLLMATHSATGGLQRLNKLEDYFSQPNILIEAFKIISAELGKSTDG
jgi:hypothetical protein